MTKKAQTTRVTPAVIHALGLDPRLLDAVKTEGTAVLPVCPSKMSAMIDAPARRTLVLPDELGERG